MVNLTDGHNAAPERNPSPWTRSFRDRPATRAAEDWGSTSEPNGSEKGSPCAIARVGPRMGAPEGLPFRCTLRDVPK